MINVKKLLNGEISCQTFEYEFIIEFSGTDYTFPSPVKVHGEIKNAGGYIPLTATCELEIVGECARCLAPVREKLTVDFSRTVAVSLEAEDEDDEYLQVSDGCIEVDEPIRDEVLLSLPMRLLCFEDCKGLCPKCGIDLNKGKCSCSDRMTDPRWSILKSFSEGK
ncbi:MAG: DUF177 domain-containing protein [Clostridia bacterium]|nr:DUF177 domain-containing protein [Clostridia bacterium]